MADELQKGPPGEGVFMTFALQVSNPAAAATVDAILALGGTGIEVPTGHEFHPMYLYVESNVDLTAGTLDAKVTDDGTELANGPQPQLADTVQRKSAVKGRGVSPIAAGAIVGVSVTTNAGYLPVTADHDIILGGEMKPV